MAARSTTTQHTPVRSCRRWQQPKRCAVADQRLWPREVGAWKALPPPAPVGVVSVRRLHPATEQPLPHHPVQRTVDGGRVVPEGEPAGGPAGGRAGGKTQGRGRSRARGAMGAGAANYGGMCGWAAGQLRAQRAGCICRLRGCVCGGSACRNCSAPQMRMRPSHHHQLGDDAARRYAVRTTRSPHAVCRTRTRVCASPAGGTARPAAGAGRRAQRTASSLTPRTLRGHRRAHTWQGHAARVEAVGVCLGGRRGEGGGRGERQHHASVLA